MCDYPLHGLPSAHQCPECGLPYDPLQALWRQSNPWRVYLVAVIAAIAVSLYGGNIVLLFQQAIGTTWAFLLYASVVLCVLVFVLMHIRRAMRRGRFAAITPEGIVIGTLGLRMRRVMIRWNELSMISAVDFVPWIKRLRKDRNLSLIGIFENRNEIKEFKAAVAEAQHRYASRPVGLEKTTETLSPESA